MQPPSSRTGSRPTPSAPGRGAVGWRIARVLLVGAGLAAIGVWLSSYIGAPDPSEPALGSLAREGFAPGFGVASAAIMAWVWTSSRGATELRALDKAAVQITRGASGSHTSTPRRADASLDAIARGQSTLRDIRQTHTPRPERRSETGSRRVSWASVRSSTGLGYAGVRTAPPATRG